MHQEGIQNINDDGEQWSVLDSNFVDSHFIPYIFLMGQSSTVCRKISCTLPVTKWRDLGLRQEKKSSE